MSSITFAAGTVIPKAWLNDVNTLTYTIFSGLTALPTSGKILRSNGTSIVGSTSTFADTYTSGTILSATSTNTVSGIANISVAQGGTGLTTLTLNNVILGNGTSAVSFVAPGNSGNVLTSNGTTWLSSAASSVLTTKGDLQGFSSVAARVPVGTDSYSLVANSGATVGLQYLPPNMGFSLLNGDLAFSVGSSALTVAIKGWDGNDPSATNPVYVAIRSATAATSLPTILALTAATSVVVSSGSTLGTANSTAFRVWVVGFNDAGTFRLGVINCLTTVAGAGAGRDVTAIYPLSGWGIASSTAEGGAGAADNSQVFYTGTAVTSKGYTVLGYATWETGLGTAGTWSAGPSRSQLFILGTSLPGSIVQRQSVQTGAVATGTTVIPDDDTIIQNNEGDQYMSQAITPISAANALAVDVGMGYFGANVVSAAMACGIFQDSTANALATSGAIADGTGSGNQVPPLSICILASGTASTTFKFRAGMGSAGTTTFNGRGGGRRFGGTADSYIKIHELMG